MTYCCIFGFAMLFAGFMGGWGWVWIMRQLGEK